MQVAPSGGHASTVAPNLESMQVAFFLAGDITQVKESIPWVRCAFGNVYVSPKTLILQILVLDSDEIRFFSIVVC